MHAKLASVCQQAIRINHKGHFTEPFSRGGFNGKEGEAAAESG